jgi:hypothetical protein
LCGGSDDLCSMWAKMVEVFLFRWMGYPIPVKNTINFQIEHVFTSKHYMAMLFVPILIL